MKEGMGARPVIGPFFPRPIIARLANELAALLRENMSYNKE